MNNQITSTHELAETEWDGHTEPSDVETNMVATKDAEGRGIEFHVSMRDYTKRDMDALIVEAAARVLVSEHGKGKTRSPRGKDHRENTGSSANS